MITGQITLNAVADKEMIAIIQAQDASAGTLAISQMQPTNAGANPPKQIFNNVTITWNTEAGFRTLAAMLHTLVNLTP
jgi:hypothetical protein